jgi:tetratricopeptide (TPR) repeat protein
MIDNRPMAAPRLQGLSPTAVRLLAEAGTYLERGDSHAAAAALEGATALAPDHPEVLRLCAVARMLENRGADAVTLLRRALVLRPDDALLYNNLGSALRTIGDAGGALAAFGRACGLEPTLAAAWFNLGKAHRSLAQSHAAQPALERAVALAPEHIAARIMLGDNLKALGRIDEAVAAYRATLVRHPDAANAWWCLANLKTLRFDASDARALERLCNQPDLADADRAVAGFALAKALEDQDRYADAWVALGRANALRRRQKPWDAGTFNDSIDAITAAFDRAPSIPRAQAGQEVIFIVSLPRSGSTLAEQILASHPQVEGAGELHDLGLVLTGESERRGSVFPYWVPFATDADWERLGQDYLERTARWRVERPRFTDKSLDNWLYLGAAAAMLPGARFVHCQRDPLETALSIYRQWFNQGQDFSYALDDIAACMNGHRRLMRHWLDRWPARIFTQSLESLQQDPDAAVRQLLDFAGLSFDPRCIDFHRSGREVRTASAAQVRSPLRGDTRKAPLFGDCVQPLRALLGEP